MEYTDVIKQFVELSLEKQIEALNEAINYYGNTDGIYKVYNFSFKWAENYMKKMNVKYVEEYKCFKKNEEYFFSAQEINELKEIIKKYKEQKNNNLFNDSDIRLYAGKCKEKHTRSFVLDKNISEEWSSFVDKFRFISSSDLLSGALEEFIDKYK